MENLIIQEMKELFNYYNCESTILDIIYNVITMLMLIVSTVSLIIACRVYRQTGIIHKENMNLSKRMHADSLTPFIIIEKVYNCICFSTERFPHMSIEKLEVREQLCLINNKTEVNISEIKGKIQVKVVIYNISDIPAEVDLKCSYLGIQRNKCEYLMGEEKKTIYFEDEILSLEKNVLNNIMNNDVYVNYNLSYNGPGMSATDTVSGKIRMDYSSTGNIVDSIIKQSERKREYVKENYE